MLRSHFYLRTLSDSDPRNPGSHPIGAVQIINDAPGCNRAIVTVCSPCDKFNKSAARVLLAAREIENRTISLSPYDTLSSVLRSAGFRNRKVLNKIDWAKAERLFEIALEDDSQQG